MTEFEGTQDETANKDKIKAYIVWLETEEEKYQQDYSAYYDNILSIFLSHGAGSLPVTPISISSVSDVDRGPKYRNRQDLLPEALAKGITPLEFETWMEKFLFWHNACFGSADPADRSMAVELRMKLDSDWSSLLRNEIDRNAASYNDIIAAIRKELLVQDPTLTRRATLFSLSLEKGESFIDFIT